jgi:TetR/AcrR family fatty acid metabolism transcriptional regulator
VPERTTAAEEKRRTILDAAVRVFARKGYHTCRVGDIANEAGVAYGLVYHYFSSKEEVLETVFRENWRMLVDALRDVEESDAAPREQIRLVAAIVLRTWRDRPDLVRVLVREVARSPQLQREIGEVAHAFAALERIVAHGQEEGDFRRDLDTRLASYVLYGALEEILTGWVLGQLPDSDEDVARAERAVVQMLCDGLVAAPAPVAD